MKQSTKTMLIFVSAIMISLSVTVAIGYESSINLKRDAADNAGAATQTVYVDSVTGEQVEAPKPKYRTITDIEKVCIDNVLYHYYEPTHATNHGRAMLAPAMVGRFAGAADAGDEITLLGVKC